MQRSSIFLRQQLGHFFPATVAARALQLWRGWGCGTREGVREDSGAEEEGCAAPSPSAPAGQVGRGLGDPHLLELWRLRAGGRDALLRDFPFLQDDLSLPGRQLALVIAQCPQLLRLLFLPLYLRLLLPFLLFSADGVRAERSEAWGQKLGRTRHQDGRGKSGL